MAIDFSLNARRARKRIEDFEARSEIVELAFKDVNAMGERGELPKRDNLTLFTACVGGTAASLFGGVGYSMHVMDKKMGGSVEELYDRCEQETGHLYGQELQSCVDAVFVPARDARNEALEGTTVLGAVFVAATLAAAVRAKLTNNRFEKAHRVAMDDRIAFHEQGGVEPPIG